MSKEEKGSVWCNLWPAKVGNAITWTSRKDCLWSPTAHPPLWAVPAWPAPPFCKRNPSPPPTDYFENNPRPQALLCLRPGVGVGASSSSQEGPWAATPPSICMQAQSQGEKCSRGATLAPPSLCTWLHYACIWLSAIPAGGKGAKRGRQEESGPWPLLHPHLKLQASPTPRARHLFSSKHPQRLEVLIMHPVCMHMGALFMHMDFCNSCRREC